MVVHGGEPVMTHADRFYLIQTNYRALADEEPSYYHRWYVDKSGSTTGPKGIGASPQKARGSIGGAVFANIAASGYGCCKVQIR
jgi:hypothetical protein